VIVLRKPLTRSAVQSRSSATRKQATTLSDFLSTIPSGRAAFDLCQRCSLVTMQKHQLALAQALTVGALLAPCQKPKPTPSRRANVVEYGSNSDINQERRINFSPGTILSGWALPKIFPSLRDTNSSVVGAARIELATTRV
jgi:hypothetical protein